MQSDLPPSPAVDRTSTSTFVANTYPLRVHSGQGALTALPAELARAGVRRAMVICGRSVHTSTSLVARIEELAGARFAGVYFAMREGAPRDDVEAAALQAQNLNADALIAVGAGSVTKAARVVAIRMAETGPLHELATQYDADGRGRTTRLSAIKCPIFNVLTAATTSQARAGASIRDDARDHQLEFFDPKTRARVVFWDAEALQTAPPFLVRSAAAMEYWWSLMNLAGSRGENPLVMASRHHAWKLSSEALPRLANEDDWKLRVDLCAASLLRVRDEDDGGVPLGVPSGGGPMRMHPITRAVYMLAVGLFNSPARMNQAEAFLALTAPAIRVFGDLCPDVVARLGDLLHSPTASADAVASQFDRNMHSHGFSPREQPSTIDEDTASKVVQYALRVFNCNADGWMNDKQGRLRDTLASTYRPSVGP